MPSPRAASSSSDRPAGRSAGSHLGRSNDYFAISMRPGHGLVFLGALVAIYEVGTIFYLTDQRAGITHTIRARRLLDLFFANFGIAGFMATGLAMLTVLFVWHMLSRDSWRIRPAVLAGMALEAALWSLPLVVFGAVFQRAAANASVLLSDGRTAGDLLPLLLAGTQAADPATGGLFQLPWQARVTIAIGAGIYEEMLFRLVGITAVHFVAKDLLQAKELTARIIAVGVTAAAFAAYHDVTALSRTDQWTSLTFFAAAGVYFGVLCLTRGFAIAVATHAIYDVLVLVVLTPRN